MIELVIYLSSSVIAFFISTKHLSLLSALTSKGKSIVA